MCAGFLEKPRADEITTNHINAGIYVLEPDTFDRMPAGVPCSIERQYFPSLVERGETFVAHIYPGYWIDIGTPEKHIQVHRDIMDGRYVAAPFQDLAPATKAVSPGARVDGAAVLEGPCFVDEGAVIKAGARIGPYSVIGRGTEVDEGASVAGAILWPQCHVSLRRTSQTRYWAATAILAEASASTEPRCSEITPHSRITHGPDGFNAQVTKHKAQVTGLLLNRAAPHL